MKPAKIKVLITEPGWWVTKDGHAVAIQYWDHDFQPCSGANWRAMVILEIENRQIRDYQCIWYTIYGGGFRPDYKPYEWDWDIARKAEPHEIPADKPEAWMPGYDDKVWRKLRSA